MPRSRHSRSYDWCIAKAWTSPRYHAIFSAMLLAVGEGAMSNDNGRGRGVLTIWRHKHTTQAISGYTEGVYCPFHSLVVGHGHSKVVLTYIRLLVFVVRFDKRKL